MTVAFNVRETEAEPEKDRVLRLMVELPLEVREPGERERVPVRDDVIVTEDGVNDREGMGEVEDVKVPVGVGLTDSVVPVGLGGVGVGDRLGDRRLKVRDGEADRVVREKEREPLRVGVAVAVGTPVRVWDGLNV